MKKLLVVVLVIAIALIGASSAMAAIRNSKHDLSSTSTTTGPKESTANLSACQFCHTPHLGANPVVAGAPLWNRSISADGSYTAAGGGTYQVYGTADGQIGVAGATLHPTTVNAPGPNSKTCLSCHDGTLGIGTVLVGTAGTFDNPTGSLDAQNRLVNGLAAIGTDLRQEHPVGLTVTPGRAGLDQIANMEADGAEFYGVGNNQMECASCHDPHGNDSVYGGVMSPFLRMNRSTMCTDCHIDK